MQKLLIILLLLLFGNLSANFTCSVDILYYKKGRLGINQIPLSPSLNKLILEESINYENGQHMKCLEGYRIWELRNDSLFLKNIQNCAFEDLVDLKGESFISNKNEIFAHWINEKIYNQYGKHLFTISDQKIFEYDREFEVENGKLKKIKDYDNRKSSESIYKTNPALLSKFWLDNIYWKKSKDIKKEIISMFC